MPKTKSKQPMKFVYKLAIALASAAVLLIILFWILCLNHVGVTNVGIAYNSLSGEISVQNHPGWYVTSPFVRVAHLSLLPMRVTIPSNATIINSKIVRFRPEGAVDFIKRQGFSWQLCTEQDNIMLGYAYSGQRFSFLDIVEEAQSEHAGQN